VQNARQLGMIGGQLDRNGRSQRRRLTHCGIWSKMACSVAEEWQRVEAVAIDHEVADVAGLRILDLARAQTGKISWSTM
jgi:hypothetical protein